MRLVEPTKVCANPECPNADQRQPWSNFYACRKWPDGTTRVPHSRCKPCMHKAAHARRRNDPRQWALHLASHRQQYVTMTPEQRAIKRDRNREYMRRRHNVSPDRFRTIAKPLRHADVVDSAPFVAWFESVQARDGTTRKEAAERLGVAEKGIRMMQSGEQPTVELSTVERALIADDTITLRELYPDLYLEAA